MSISNFLRGFGFSKKNEEKEKLHQKEIDELNKKLQAERHLADILSSELNNLIAEQFKLGNELQKQEEDKYSFENFLKEVKENCVKNPLLKLSIPKQPQQQLELDLKPKVHIEEKKVRLHAPIPMSVYEKIMCNANHNKTSIGNIIADAFKNIQQLGNIDYNPMIKPISNQQKAIDKKRSIMLEKGYLSTAAIDEVLGYPGATSKLCQNGLKHIRQENLIFVKREDFEKHMKKRAKKKRASKKY